MTVVKETHLCVQSENAFNCFIVIVNGRRIFATEDEQYLRGSISIFKQEDDVTIALDCDRNTAELQIGPQLDVELLSPLYVRKLKDSVQFQTGAQGARTTHFEVPLDDWITAIQRC